MSIGSLTIENLGPIGQCRVELGDLTVLIGPQASGKSLLLQTLKAVEDIDDIVEALKRHGYHLREELGDLVELLYGEGMRGLISSKTSITVDGEPWDLAGTAKDVWSKRGRKSTRVFYIPAQRVLTIQEGWPRPFTAFDVGAPYVVKRFSEDLRRLVEEGLGSDTVFPSPRRWKREIRELVSDAIFHGAVVRIDRAQIRKRIVLQAGSSGDLLPFMSWSAGQREFIPLMLGLYWLMPTQGAPRRQHIEMAIIEEPEMGLHPRAVSALALTILDLLKRRYRVVLSTHSPHMLELLWAISAVRESDRFAEVFAELFAIKATPAVKELATAVKRKNFRVYFMAHAQSGEVVTKEISSLDPASDDVDVASWGGLTEFSARASAIVGQMILPFLESREILEPEQP